MRKLLAVLIVGLGLAMLLATASAQETVKEKGKIAERLVAISPCSGNWSVTSFSGTLDLVFTMKNGELEGNIVSATGSPSQMTGKVMWLKVLPGEADPIQFTAASKANYYLKLQDNMLTGRFQPKSMGKEGKVSLTCKSIKQASRE